MIREFGGIRIRDEGFGAIVYEKEYGQFFALNKNQHDSLISNLDEHQLGLSRADNVKISRPGNPGQPDSINRKLQTLRFRPTKQDILGITQPLVIGLIVTTKCNLACKYCYIKGLPKIELEESGINEIILKLKAMGIMAVWISGGEPFLWTPILKLIEKLKENDVPVGIDSNGTVPDAKLYLEAASLGADLRISLDSHLEKTNDNLRGLTQRVVQNLNKLIGTGTKVAIMTVVNKLNYLELEDFAYYLSKLGVFRWILISLNSSFIERASQDSLKIEDRQFKSVTERVSRLAENIGLKTIVIVGNKPRSTLLLAPDMRLFTNGKADSERIFMDFLSQFDGQVFGPERLSKIEHLKKYVNYLA